jgi:hypothetical protein
LWTIDLAKNADFAKRAGLEWADIANPRLQFAGASEIVVGFENDAPNSPRTLDPKHFDFDLLAVESGSGKIAGHFSLPVVNLDSDVQPLAGGDLAVLSGESFIRMSGSFETLQTYPTPLRYHGGPVPHVVGGIPDLSVVYEEWKMSVTPLGHTVVLRHHDAHDAELIWLDAKDLSERRRVSETGAATSLDATEDFALMSYYRPPYRSLPESHAVPECRLRQCQAEYVAGENAVLQDLAKQYQIVGHDGTVLLRGSLLSGTDNVARSMDGSRIAFTTGIRTLGRFTDGRTHTAVVIVDLMSRKELKRIVFDQAVERRGEISRGVEMALALSPDGHRIAVLDGTKLICYSLP